MVLWEITLATAYFLGLKRTYKLALRIQRRLVSPQNHRIRQFLYGRTRAVFDMAVKVHQNVQQRDIEVGRNLGNWILRWLDRMKPSAEIRGHTDVTVTSTSTNTKMIKQVSYSSHSKPSESSRAAINQKFCRYMFNIPLANRWRKPFPTIAMMMRHLKPAGTMIQHRHYSICGSEAVKADYKRGSFDDVIRKDILQWMHRN